MRSNALFDMHLEMSKRHEELGMFYEQQPLQFASYPFVTVNLPINYNIGWWRFNQPTTTNRLQFLRSDGKQILFGDMPAVCFHAHTLKNLGDTNFGQFLVDKVLALMKATPGNAHYQELVRFIEGYKQA